MPTADTSSSQIDREDSNLSSSSGASGLSGSCRLSYTLENLSRVTESLSPAPTTEDLEILPSKMNMREV
eukprot:scaffold8940_cov154-Skeletonema_marinoi.AAC.2